MVDTGFAFERRLRPEYCVRFIGGSQDGRVQTFPAPPPPVWRVPRPYDLHVSALTDGPPVPPVLRVERYVLGPHQSGVLVYQFDGVYP